MTEKLDLESIIKEIGSFGRYQIVIFSLLCVPVTLSALFTFNYAFTAQIQNYRCFIPECEDNSTREFEPDWLEYVVPYHNDKPSKCERYFPKIIENASDFDNDKKCSIYNFDKDNIRKCDKLFFEDDKHTTIANDFDMLCDENMWTLTIIGTIDSTGEIFSVFFTGLFSDSFGRRPALIWGLILCMICGLVRSFSTSYLWFITTEFIGSILGAATSASAIILGMELTDSSKRALGSTLLFAAFAIGEALSGLFASFSPNWRVYLQISFLPGLIMLAYFWIIPESLNWLLTKNKYEEIKQTFLQAAKINGTHLSKNTLEKIDRLKSLNSSENYVLNATNQIKNGPDTIKSDSFVDIFKYPSILIRIILITICWITISLLYFGLSLFSNTLPGSTYFNFIMVCLIEIPGGIIRYFCVDRFGRKPSFSISLFVAGLSCLSFIFVNSKRSNLIGLILFLIGKCAITISLSVIYLFAAELFPTSLRQLLMGICSMFARIGSIAAPQMPLLVKIWAPLPMVLFASMAILSGLLALLLPETLNSKLPDTIEEANQIGQIKN